MKTWRIVGASVRGTSHAKRDQPCHDAFAYQMLPDGSVLLAVSDGAGSAARAEEGSAYVVRTALASLEGHVLTQLPADADAWDTVLRAAFHDTHVALRQYAKAEDTAVRDYAATLVLVVLTERWTIAGLIGDCAAIVLSATGELESLLPSQKGEYANATYFLSQDDALERLDVAVQDKTAQGIAMMSDGLVELALNVAHNRPHSPFFKPLFAFMASVEDEGDAVRHLTAFLDSERVNARTDDDKTLLLGWRPPHQPQPEGAELTV